MYKQTLFCCLQGKNLSKQTQNQNKSGIRKSTRGSIKNCSMCSITRRCPLLKNTGNSHFDDWWNIRQLRKKWWYSIKIGPTEHILIRGGEGSKHSCIIFWNRTFETSVFLIIARFTRSVLMKSRKTRKTIESWSAKEVAVLLEFWT